MMRLALLLVVVSDFSVPRQSGRTNDVVVITENESDLLQSFTFGLREELR